MNREIEFRGRTIPYKEDDFEYEGEWVYGYYHEDHNGKGYIIQADRSGRLYPGVNVIPSTIGQYTGLTDKNGVKIWEGDRLRIPADLWIGEQSVGKNKGTFNDDAFVEYHGGSFRINQIGNDAKLYYGVIDFSRNTGADVAEVIGTIHDTHLTQQS